MRRADRFIPQAGAGAGAPVAASTDVPATGLTGVPPYAPRRSRVLPVRPAAAWCFWWPAGLPIVVRRETSGARAGGAGRVETNAAADRAPAGKPFTRAAASSPAAVALVTILARMAFTVPPGSAVPASAHGRDTATGDHGGRGWMTLGRHGPAGRLHLVARTAPLSAADRAQLGPLLTPAGPGHPGRASPSARRGDHASPWSSRLSSPCSRSNSAQTVLSTQCGRTTGAPLTAGPLPTAAHRHGSGQPVSAATGKPRVGDSVRVRAGQLLKGSTSRG